MSLKKPRIHLTGISNIDYKSKQEIKKIFNNFNNFSNNQQKEMIPDKPSTYKSPNTKNPNMFNVSLKDAIPVSGDSMMYADTYRIRNEIKQIIDIKKLTGRSFLVNQVVQLHNNMLLKHGLMLVGDSLSGKTTTLKLLQALNKRKVSSNPNNTYFSEVEIRTIF